MNKVYNETVDSRKNLIILTLLSGVIGGLNVLILQNYSFSLALVLVEATILLYFLIKNDIYNYFGCYLIFLSLSFEFNFILGVEDIGLYGFKSFKILGFNLGIVFLIPIVLKLLFSKIKISRLKHQNPSLYKFIKYFTFITFISVIVGILNFVFNDNDIQNLRNSESLLIAEIYQGALFPILLIISFMYIYFFENSKLIYLKRYLVAILFGVCFSTIISFLSNSVGHYGGLNMLIIQGVSSFIPFILLIVFFDKIPISKFFVLILFAAALFILLKFNASGKLFMYIIFLPFIIIFNLIKRGKIKSFFFLIFLLPLLIAYSLKSVEGIDNLLFTIKLNQAMSMINIFDKEWLSMMPESPKFRISEFINIIFEYIEKPYLLITGKGYLGTIKDHQNLFIRTGGAFSDAQWDNGFFYAMHMSINSIFLTHGLLGLLLIFKIIKLAFRKLFYSWVGVIGVTWFLIYYGYSITIGAFGITVLLYSLYELNE